MKNKTCLLRWICSSQLKEEQFRVILVPTSTLRMKEQRTQLSGLHLEKNKVTRVKNSHIK
ncbi:hypothetical protein M8C21_030011 [Ambrosia artemisiifolia]|uniref:Uncharacterized protein n=1 Tax=Ambrosia artemisiifolia TaxID=4212 RepID=A0AAD5CIZ8_AMBAR|nr:hypothetical protein M8C21_030011 [Ambrosia artemisiifolia]